VSQENVEIVRRVFLATSSGDPAATAEAFDPDIEWDMTAVGGWAEKDVYRGAEVPRFLRDWADAWQDWRFDVEEVRAAGDEQVFVAIHEWATGVESLAQVDQRRWFAVEVRDRRIVRVRMFSERGDAVAAVGLE
jgi:ketosteroid isomerase-like protein